ncbi:MAG: hypothetical protein EAZ27_00995 [Cytophagales bacterium]|nr:MAG: hypothetical protein EAZ27_00995 [Cytophagales bacterium]
MSSQISKITRLLRLISPKAAENVVNEIASKSDSEAQFLIEITKYHIAQLFDDKASWDDISFALRSLIIENHIDIDMMANDIDEYTGSDNMLAMVAKSFAKQGWAVCDFNDAKELYHLSIVPIKSKSELKKEVEGLNWYVQFF